MSRYLELRREIAGRFVGAGIESAATEADLLISGVAGIPRGELFFRAEDGVAPAAEARIRALAVRRERHEPLQYLLGVAPFMDFELEVTPAVLIPRPETELLVEWVAEQLAHGGSVLDLGTGSGAIALGVAAERADAAVTGVDVSSAALEVARRNRERCGLRQVEFLQSDLFSALNGRTFDLVAANLPYVTLEEYEMLSPEVRCFEPQLALTAADDGFALIAAAATRLPAWLNPRGQAIFELSPPQAERLAALFRETGAAETRIIRDYTGRERFVTAMWE